MLDYLRLNDLDLLDFTDGTAHRDISRIEGLLGLAQPRGESKVRSEAHGVTNRSRFMSSKMVSIEGECWGITSAEARQQFSKVEAAFYATLTEPRGAWLLWPKDGVDDGGPVVEYLADPTFETAEINLYPYYGDVSTTAVESTAWLYADCSQSMLVTDNTGVSGSNRDVAVKAAGLEAVTPGVSYTGTAVVNVTGALRSSGVGVAIIFEDEAGSQTIVDGAWVNTGAGVKTPTVTAVAPAGAVIAHLRIHTYGLNIAAPFYLGHVEIVETGEVAGTLLGGVDTKGRLAYPSDALGARVKLAGVLTAPLEGGAAYVPYQAQVEQLDPRAYAQVEAIRKSGTPIDSTGGFGFPFSFPFGFSENAETSVEVTNAGEVETPPTIRIYGPVSNPRYVNEAGAQIKIIGDVEYGSYLEIDHGARTVKVNGIASAMRFLDAPESTFFELDPGAQVISMYVDSYGAGSYLEVRSRDAYAG